MSIKFDKTLDTLSEAKSLIEKAENDHFQQLEDTLNYCYKRMRMILEQLEILEGDKHRLDTYLVECIEKIRWEVDEFF